MTDQQPDATPFTPPAPMTRRDFVKTSAAVASAGVLIGPSWAGPRRDETIKVGLVGCGGRGTGAATQAMNADPNTLLTAMGDAFDDRIEASLSSLRGNEGARDKIKVQAADRYSGFDAYKQVIDSGVDVVILATPPVFRPAHLEYAINAGKHVFCEKPVAVDAPGVRSVLATAAEAKRRNLALMSGFCWRYNFPQRELYRRVQEGQIGELRAMQTTYNAGPLGDVPRQDGWSDMEWQLRNWKAFTWSSGDHIVEQAIHAIDWIAWAMNGELPERAYAVGGRQCRSGPWTGNMYDHFSVVYEFASGARGFHTCRQIPNNWNDNTAYLMGSKGTGYSNPWNPGSIRFEGESPWRYDGPRNDMYQTEHNELMASIRKGEPINDGEWMAHSTMMGIMGRMCAYTGQRLTWEQCMNSEENLTPTTWEWGDMPFPSVALPGQTKFL